MVTIAASRRSPSGVFCPPIWRYRYFRHLGLLPLVTRTEYSCTTLHKLGRGVSEKIPLLGNLVNVEVPFMICAEQEANLTRERFRGPVSAPPPTS